MRNSGYERCRSRTGCRYFSDNLRIGSCIKAELISPAFLEEEEFDQPLGVGSGAGVIFGTTGGVMEAALRTAYYVLNGKNPDPDLFKVVRGMEESKKQRLKSQALRSKRRLSVDLAIQEN